MRSLITTVRLNVEKDQLVGGIDGIDEVLIGLQSAQERSFLED
jgi:hypothetical protein